MHTIASADLAKRVDVEPVGVEDWEILEANAGFLEENLLAQICVVAPLQEFPVWIGSNMIHMRVLDSDYPVLRLQRDSEVVVAPKPRIVTSNKEDADKHTTLTMRVHDACPPLNDFDAGTMKTPQEVYEAKVLNMNCIAEVHPDVLQQLVSVGEWATRRKTVCIHINDTSSMALMLKGNSNVPYAHISLSEATRSALGVEVLTNVTVIYGGTFEDYTPEKKPPSFSVRIPQGLDSGEVEKGLRQWQVTVGSKELCFLEQCTVSIFVESLRIEVEVHSKKKGLVWVDTNTVDFSLDTTTYLSNPKKVFPHYRDACLTSLGGNEDAIDTLLGMVRPLLSRQHVQRRVALGGPVPSHIYICGPHACGKTTLAKALARRMRVTHGAFSVYLDCALLRGQKRSTVQSELMKALDQAKSHSPSMVVLDNLDLLLPTPSQGEAQEDSSTRWLAEWLEEEMMSMNSSQSQREQKLDKKQREQACLTGAVACVALGTSSKSLRGNLMKVGLFEGFLELFPMQAHQRAEVLVSSIALLEQYGCVVSVDPSLDLEEVAHDADGYAPGDLAMLVDRAWHACVCEVLETKKSQGVPPCKDQEYVLTETHFKSAFDGFVASAMIGVSLAKSTVKWTDVGGLHEVRTALKETLELPLQFSRLYERSPQRLASGILLYGPPGCGKTLLAGAVAAECGMNFVSVKGPEVLDKYIGASEKAIRDLFGRAAAASPCIIFFDEIDSIVPKRGNDSSGVTDRVVNQLLTFLDGVEARTGVYVMAATSRPDLVDPALLRPGRLDKQLFCNFPSEEERLDILRVVGSSMHLTPEAQACLPELARKGELLTGADLQAVLYSAHLGVVHEELDTDDTESGSVNKDGGNKGTSKESNNKTPPPQERVITLDLLMTAFDDTRASVPPKERMRYNHIYSKFTGDRVAGFEPGSGVDESQGSKTMLM